MVTAVEARPVERLVRLPGVRVDHPATPAILDEKARRRVRVIRGHEVVGVPSERMFQCIPQMQLSTEAPGIGRFL